MKFLPIVLCIITVIHSTNIQSTPSFQGFRGAINTPNTKTLNEGEFEFLYSNQIENISPTNVSDYRDNKEQKNFFLNMGVLPNLDLNFQYAYGFDDVVNKKYLSNRILNTKFLIPFIPKDLFQMAIGIQDIGGGNPYIGNKYAVISKEFDSVRTNIGYAKGDNEGSINGIFGSIEYQPSSWLQLVGEYDTKEWNGAVKSQFNTNVGKQKVNLGLMAKSSLDYNDVYFGLYANLPFNNTAVNLPSISSDYSSNLQINDLKFNNTAYMITNDTVYFEYENTLYVHNDIDALGIVLGVLANTTIAKKIEISIKKSNIIQYSLSTNTEDYKKFLKTGLYHENLLEFKNTNHQRKLESKNSDRFKPLITLEPNLILVDGGEYSDVGDYTLAMQAEIAMRLAKGTFVSGRYNIPISITDNFKEGGIFDYRNRHKTTTELDQLLLTQYFKIGSTYPWVNMAQVGRFDKQLEGISLESAISDSTGKHQLLLKVSKLEDSLYQEMDKYNNKDREEKLLSYRYYLDSLNSNIKLTVGEFLYGDEGASFSLERYFSDISLRFDIAQTEHKLKGENTLARLQLSIPFGPKKRFKSKYVDMQGGTFTYEKKKNIVSVGSNSYALPHHLKEVNNKFTLEKYYLNGDRFHPNYIKANHNRLRNIFISR